MITLAKGPLCRWEVHYVVANELHVPSITLVLFGQALFSRAVLQTKQLQASPLMWRCQLAFEQQRGNREAARRVFLNAISACPWDKALWMDALESLAPQVRLLIQECWLKRVMRYVY